MAFVLVEGGAAETGRSTISVAISTFGLGFTPNQMVLDFDSGLTLPHRTFKHLIPDLRMPDGLSDGDSVTLNVRLTDGASTEDLSTTFTYRETLQEQFPYSELAQYIANGYPDHSPVRNKKDSVGHKMINIFAEQVKHIETVALDNEQSLSLVRASTDEPDVLMEVELPHKIVGNDIPSSSNVLINGGFLLADARHAHNWRHQGTWSFETADPLVGFRSVKLSPPLAADPGDDIASLGQVLRDRVFDTSLTLTVAYRPTGAGVAVDRTNHIHLWLFFEDGTTDYLSSTLSTETSSWKIEQINTTLNKQVHHVVVAVTAESDASETVVTDIGYATLRIGDSGNVVWTASLNDVPRYFRAVPLLSLDSSPMGMIATDDIEDFWHDAVPTRMSSVEYIAPLDYSDKSLYTEHVTVTVAADGDTEFTLDKAVLLPDTANVHVNTEAFTAKTNYEIVGTELTWTGPALSMGDVIHVVFKRGTISDDASTAIASGADEVLTATSDGQTAFTLAGAIPAGGTPIVLFRGMLHRVDVAWTHSGTSFTWSGPPPVETGDKLYIVHDLSTLSEYTILGETKGPFFRYDRFRDRYVAEYFLDRINNTIKKRLSAIPDDIIATYSKIGYVTDLVDYATEDMPAVHAFTILHDKILIVIREDDVYKLIVCNKGTPHPEPDYLEVHWVEELPIDSDIMLLDCRILDGDQQRLHLYSDEARYQVRLHYDYAAYSGTNNRLYLREQPPAGTVVQPLTRGTSHYVEADI